MTDESKPMRMRVMPLPHDQYVIVIDRMPEHLANTINGSEAVEWLRGKTDGRCVGLLAFGEDAEVDLD